MTKIHFLINEQSVNSMTWEEYEAFENAQEGNIKLKDLRPVLARFMTNGNDLPVDHKKAMKILGELPLPKIKETVEIFMGTLQDSAIPKANGSGSQLPTEAKPADSLSPAG